MKISQLTSSGTVYGANPVTLPEANPVTLPGDNPVAKMQLKNVLSESTADDTVNSSHKEQATEGAKYEPCSSNQAARENIAWQDMQGRRQAEKFSGMHIINLKTGEHTSVAKKRQDRSESEHISVVRSGPGKAEEARKRKAEAENFEIELIKQKMHNLFKIEKSSTKRYQAARQFSKSNNQGWPELRMQKAAGITSSMAARLRQIETGSPESKLIRDKLGWELDGKSANEQYRIIRRINRDEGHHWLDKNMQLAARIQSSAAARIRHIEEKAGQGTGQ